MISSRPGKRILSNIILYISPTLDIDQNVGRDEEFMPHVMFKEDTLPGNMLNFVDKQYINAKYYNY